MYDEILEILQDIRSDVDFESEEALVDDEILDSFDIVSLAGELLDRYGIQVTAGDLEPENFNSVEAIVEFVKKKQAE